MAPPFEPVPDRSRVRARNISYRGFTQAPFGAGGCVELRAILMAQYAFGSDFRLGGRNERCHCHRP